MVRSKKYLKKILIVTFKTLEQTANGRRKTIFILFIFRKEGFKHQYRRSYYSFKENKYTIPVR